MRWLFGLSGAQPFLNGRYCRWNIGDVAMVLKEVDKEVIPQDCIAGRITLELTAGRMAVVRLEYSYVKEMFAPLLHSNVQPPDRRFDKTCDRLSGRLRKVDRGT